MWCSENNLCIMFMITKYYIFQSIKLFIYNQDWLIHKILNLKFLHCIFLLLLLYVPKVIHYVKMPLHMMYIYGYCTRNGESFKDLLCTAFDSMGMCKPIIVPL